MTKRILLYSFLIGLTWYSFAQAVFSKNDKAIRGYDAVAYFTKGEAIKGSADYTSDYQGSTWLFASQEHKDLFDKDPATYAPQYGGYCAWAVSQNYTYASDPKAWKIVDNKLYLNYSLKVQKDWEADQSALIQAADKNWPALQSSN